MDVMIGEGSSEPYFRVKTWMVDTVLSRHGFFGLSRLESFVLGRFGGKILWLLV